MEVWQCLTPITVLGELSQEMHQGSISAKLLAEYCRKEKIDRAGVVGIWNDLLEEECEVWVQGRSDVQGGCRSVVRGWRTGRGSSQTFPERRCRRKAMGGGYVSAASNKDIFGMDLSWRGEGDL